MPWPGTKEPMSARSEPLFVDTNVPMYAGGRDPLLRAEAQAALRQAVRSGRALITSAEVLQEILHRCFSRRRPDQARAAYRWTTGICDEVLPVGEPQTARALELLFAYPGVEARDAVHVAVMESAGIETILTKDRAFDAIPMVVRLDPAELAATAPADR